MSNFQKFQYAEHCAAQLAYFRERQEMPLSEVIYERLEFAAIHTAFCLAVEVIKHHPELEHGLKIVRDEEYQIDTLEFPSGRHIQRDECAEAKADQINVSYCMRKTLHDHERVVDVILMELNTLVTKFGYSIFD